MLQWLDSVKPDSDSHHHTDVDPHVHPDPFQDLKPASDSHTYTVVMRAAKSQYGERSDEWQRGTQSKRV